MNQPGYALIFANGDIADGPMVRQALKEAQTPLVVAADGGARVAAHFGLRVDVLIGDMDSLSDQEVAHYVAAGAKLHQYAPEKDFTDLELALTYISSLGIGWVRIIGGLGGRIDQTLGNVYLLALPALRGRDVRMVAGRQEICLLHPGRHQVMGQPQDTISLIPMGGAVHGISTEALYYPLKDETLNFGPARGISNMMTTTQAAVTLAEGELLLVHTLGRA